MASYIDKFYKIKLCPFFAEGKCRRHESCRYAHSSEELRVGVLLKKTKLCKAWQQDSCNDVDCLFAHGEAELRSTPDFYKTTLCKFFPKGQCGMGDSCRHAHGSEDLRPSTDRRRGSALRKRRKKSIQNLTNGFMKCESTKLNTSDYHHLDNRDFESLAKGIDECWRSQSQIPSVFTPNDTSNSGSTSQLLTALLTLVCKGHDAVQSVASQFYANNQLRPSPYLNTEISSKTSAENSVEPIRLQERSKYENTINTELQIGKKATDLSGSPSLFDEFLSLLDGEINLQDEICITQDNEKYPDVLPMQSNELFFKDSKKCSLDQSDQSITTMSYFYGDLDIHQDSNFQSLTLECENEPIQNYLYDHQQYNKDNNTFISSCKPTEASDTGSTMTTASTEPFPFYSDKKCHLENLFQSWEH